MLYEDWIVVCPHYVPLYLRPYFHMTYNHFNLNFSDVGGTRSRSWLRHCAKSRKVPMGVIDIILPTAL
jgi:hypothetical protein